MWHHTHKYTSTTYTMGYYSTSKKVNHDIYKNMNEPGDYCGKYKPDRKEHCPVITYMWNHSTSKYSHRTQSRNCWIVSVAGCGGDANRLVNGYKFSVIIWEINERITSENLMYNIVIITDNTLFCNWKYLRIEFTCHHIQT